jgi:hypothetical protein
MATKGRPRSSLVKSLWSALQTHLQGVDRTTLAIVPKKCRHGAALLSRLSEVKIACPAKERKLKPSPSQTRKGLKQQETAAIDSTEQCAQLSGMTPDQVHYGQVNQSTPPAGLSPLLHPAMGRVPGGSAVRPNFGPPRTRVLRLTLNGAFSRNPERFVRKEPQPPAKPIATWINPPSRQPTEQA